MHLYRAGKREPNLLPWRFTCAVLLVPWSICFAFSSLSAQQSAVSDQAIQDLIQQLAAESYSQRQNASRELVSMGGEAIPSLLAVVQHPDPELRMRVVEVLSRMAVSDDEATRELAQREISVLAESGFPDIARLASAHVKDLGKHLQTAALKKLSSLGAITSIDEYFGDFASAQGISLIIGPDWKGTRADLNSIRWLRELNNVTLVGDQIDDALILLLVENKNMTNLVIKRALITNASIKPIMQLPQLQKLQLVYCDIDDGCYDDLKRVDVSEDDPFGTAKQDKNDPFGSSRPEIWFYGTQFSREAAEKLAKETGMVIDRRNGAFLGVYFAQGNEPCVITRVVGNSAAALAGIEVGDTILKFAGRDITIADDFRGAVSNFDPGDEVVAVVLRDNKELELKIELGRFQDIEQ